MICFGKNILFLRKLYKLQQAEMPLYTGIERATWSNYENGNTEPNLKTLADISRFFRISIDALILHDISADAHLIEKLQERKIDKSAHLSAYPIAHLMPDYLENLVMNDSGGEESKLSLYKLAQQIAEMRKDINELKAPKK